MKIAIGGAKSLSFLLVCLALVTCSRNAQKTGEDTPGGRWLHMTMPEKNALVGSFIAGYQIASDRACSLMESEFQVGNAQMLELARSQNLTPSEICRRQVGKYSRIKTNPDGSVKYDAYVNEVTAFYKLYPDHRYVPPDALLMRSDDSEDLTTTELYRDYK